MSEKPIGLILFQKRMIELRKLAGWSREQIEKQHNIRAHVVRSIETADWYPAISTILNYIKIYQEIGMMISLDYLFDASESEINNLEKMDDFIYSTFGKELLKEKATLMFYANVQGKILFINSIFDNLINQNLTCKNLITNDLPTLLDYEIQNFNRKDMIVQDNYDCLTKNAFYISDIIPEMNNDSKLILEILKGNSITASLTRLYKPINLNIKPNFNMQSSVIGIAAFSC